jgi:helix-turn-helix protein
MGFPPGPTGPQPGVAFRPPTRDPPKHIQYLYYRTSNSRCGRRISRLAVKYRPPTGWVSTRPTCYRAVGTQPSSGTGAAVTQTVELSTPVLCPAVSTDPTDATVRLDETGVSIRGDGLAEDARLDEIFDVRLGQPPQVAGKAFSAPVLTLGFERGGQRAVLFVDGEEDTLERVSALLFRRLLDGTQVAMSHPATVGGRVTDRGFDIGQLRVAPGKIGCTGIRDPLNIDLDSIVSVSRAEKELLGRQEPTVGFEYVKRGVVVGVDLSLNPPRKLNLLGRYLRREYRQTKRRANTIDPPAPVVRVLTRLYAQRGRTESQTVLATESTDPEALLQTLLDTELVELSDGEISLTTLGWVLVAERVSTTRVPSE